MDVFPPRNLGSGEPWGRTIESVIREHDAVIQSAKQEAENNNRTEQASVSRLQSQAKRMDDLIQRLDDTLTRLPRYSLSVGSGGGFTTVSGQWITAASTTIQVPADRAYAVIDCQSVVQLSAALGSPPGGYVWMSLKLTANGSSTVAPTSIGIPMGMIETNVAIRKNGTINNTFYVDDVAGQTILVEIRLYANDGVAHTEKSAVISASGMFLRDRSDIMDSGGGISNPESPPDPSNGNGGTGSAWKWPMNPDAINSRHAGGTSGGYQNPIRPSHNGLDFSWSPHFYAGMPIRAAADGVVSKAYYEPGGGGWAVEIRHDDRWYTGYYHAVPGSIQVTPGQTVVQGQHLMNAGESGNSTGPHLHFMVVDMNKTGSYWSSHVNPETFMAQYNPNDEYV